MCSQYQSAYSSICTQMLLFILIMAPSHERIFRRINRRFDSFRQVKRIPIVALAM